MKDHNGNYPLRCQKPYKRGAVCYGASGVPDSMYCIPPLNCAYDGDRARCFDKKNDLRWGEQCTPNATGKGGTCGAVNQFLQCLPSGDGHVCQRVRLRLFGNCSPEDNIVCDASTMQCDSAQNICVDRPRDPVDTRPVL